MEYPDTSTIQYGYDSQGRMSTITNGRGIAQVTNVYDTNKAAGTNLLSSVTDPPNRTTSYTYFATADARNGLMQTMTDPLLNVTSYDYETTYGLPVKITDVLGKITSIVYTPAGSPPAQAVIKDPLLNRTKINYKPRTPLMNCHLAIIGYNLPGINKQRRR